MRYTEARMKKITDEVMADIDKETVDWTLNFDDTIPEPTVLPTKDSAADRQRRERYRRRHGHQHGPAQPERGRRRLLRLISTIPKSRARRCCSISRVLTSPTGGIIYGYEGVREAMLTGRGRSYDARQDRYRAYSQRPRVHRHHRDSLHDQQGRDDQEDRRHDQREEDRGHLLYQRRIRTATAFASSSFSNTTPSPASC